MIRTLKSIYVMLVHAFDVNRTKVYYKKTWR